MRAAIRQSLRLCALASLRLKILRGYRLEPFPKDSTARREFSTQRRKDAEQRARSVVYNLAVENGELNLSELNLLRSDKQIAIPNDDVG